MERGGRAKMLWLSTVCWFLSDRSSSCHGAVCSGSPKMQQGGGDGDGNGNGDGDGDFDGDGDVADDCDSAGTVMVMVMVLVNQ